MASTYKIPQNVNLEDKIFGPLTLKQFVMALGAGMVTFVSFSTLYDVAPFAFFLVSGLAWIIAIAFMFIRPYDQPFAKFIFSFIWFATKPRHRIWKRIPSLGEISFRETPEELATATAPERPTYEEARSRLQNLAHVIDTRGWSKVDDDSDGPDASGLAGRVRGGESERKLNIFLSATEQPDDILAEEDEGGTSRRASQQLGQLLQGERHG